MKQILIFSFLKLSQKTEKQLFEPKISIIDWISSSPTNLNTFGVKFWVPSLFVENHFADGQIADGQIADARIGRHVHDTRHTGNQYNDTQNSDT